MKKSILLYLIAVCMFSCNEKEVSEPLVEPETETDISAYPFSEKDVLEGCIRIKLKKEPTDGVAVRSVNGKVTTGIQALDRSASSLKITRMERTFPYAGKFEERTRREGLHLWYNVWFSEKIVSTRAAEEVAIIDDIEMAVPIVKVVSTAASDKSPYAAFGKGVTRNSFPFDDPHLPKLWNYNNPGTESWQVAGADIRLFDVWKEYNGHPNIIVSIVDGGIELNHPDLKDNLWINTGEIPGNGIDDDGNGYIDDVYGYNFVSNTPSITPQRHGTHVAGTIGAVTNNHIGISGIAGGNGTPNSGVKLMSCQIFEHPLGNYNQDIAAEDMGAAIKYGADNGAVISQNSWGYAVNESTSSTYAGARSSYIDPAHKAAIDYFVKYAGCDNAGNQLPNSPMKGGIVLFAAGNVNSEDPRVSAPADYEKVVGVAAIGPDYKKPRYSNYGAFIDILAPGGLSEGETGIYSTTIAACGYYEYRYGTSMSCPHVSAIAALIIEKNGVGKPGFTARQLEELLLTTAYKVDAYNPNYVGKLGHGCVDATAALRATAPDSAPFQLMTNPVTNGTLSFKINSIDLAGDAVLSIVNGTGSLVWKKNIKTYKFKTVLVDIAKLAAGYYTVTYECNDSKIINKIIKY